MGVNVQLGLGLADNQRSGELGSSLRAWPHAQCLEIEDLALSYSTVTVQQTQLNVRFHLHHTHLKKNEGGEKGVERLH